MGEWVGLRPNAILKKINKTKRYIAPFIRISDDEYFTKCATMPVSKKMQLRCFLWCGSAFQIKSSTTLLCPKLSEKARFSNSLA